MWTNYTKTFSFRDCFDEDRVAGNVEAINTILKLDQKDKCHGTTISTDVLSTGITDRMEAYKGEDDGTWYLHFLNGSRGLATVSLWDYKEVHLCFEIEENLRTGELIIHYCMVKGFKDYQL